MKTSCPTSTAEIKNEGHIVKDEPRSLSKRLKHDADEDDGLNSQLPQRTNTSCQPLREIISIDDPLELEVDENQHQQSTNTYRQPLREIISIDDDSLEEEFDEDPVAVPVKFEAEDPVVVKFEPELAPESMLTHSVAELNIDNDDADDDSVILLDEQQRPVPKEVTSNNVHRQKGDEIQERAIALALTGNNIFLTGRAGTGKSWTTKQLVHRLDNDMGKRVHVTAPTGMAAINVNGTTINRWGGFGLGNSYPEFDPMIANQTKARIRETDVLVFDEVSMLSGHLFDVLECAVTIVRCYEDVKDRLAELKANGGSKHLVSFEMLKLRWTDVSRGGFADLPPWGGMQIVLVGDFFQLPPIPRESGGGKRKRGFKPSKEMMEYSASESVVGRQGTYAFQSLSWTKSNLHSIELTTVHRQAGDDGLLDLLNDIRIGAPDLLGRHGAAISAIRSPLPDRQDGILPTELYNTNRLVDTKNRAELQKLPGESIMFKAKDDVHLCPEYRKRVLHRHKLEEVAWMPYLWACVDEQDCPEELRKAKSDLVSMKSKLLELIAQKSYNEVPETGNQIELLEAKVIALENADKEKSTITLDSVDEWLKKFYAELDAASIFNRVEAFQKQVMSDKAKLKDHAQETFFERDCRVGPTFELKKNAQVMLLWNLDIAQRLVNGSRGVVLAFIKGQEYRRILENEIERRSNEGTNITAIDNKEKANKMDTACTDDSKPVALAMSQANPSMELSDLDALTHLTDIQRRLLHLKIEQIQEELQKVDKASRYIDLFPVVKFDSATVLLLPQSFEKIYKGCGTAQRWQLPLTHAWAISTHKSQGMTIDWLRVDLHSCFAAGQAYVACSRGTSAASMQVDNFSENEIQTSKVVQNFYEALSTGDSNRRPLTWVDLQLQRVEIEATCNTESCRKCSRGCKAFQAKTGVNRG